MEQEQWVECLNDDKKYVTFSQKYQDLVAKVLGEGVVGDGAVPAIQAHREACNVSNQLDNLVALQEKKGKDIGGNLLKLIQYSRQWKTRFDKYEEVKED